VEQNLYLCGCISKTGLKKPQNQIKLWEDSDFTEKEERTVGTLKCAIKAQNPVFILIRDSYEAMMQAQRQYQTTKDVIFAGRTPQWQREWKTA